MNKKKMKKQVESAADGLQDAQERLKHAEAKLDSEAAKAEAKNTDLKPARAKKLNASIEAEKKNVAKAQKELTHAQEKYDKAAGKQAAPELPSGTEASVDITDLGSSAAAEAIQAALDGADAVTVTGELSAQHEPLRLSIRPGGAVFWKAAYSADCKEAAIVLEAEAAEAVGEAAAPLFSLEEGGSISNAAEGGTLLAADTVSMRIDGGTAQSTHGNGIETEGTVEMLGGVLAVGGPDGEAACALRCSAAKLAGGFVFGRAPKESDASGGTLAKAAIVQPAPEDDLKEGSGCICVWVSENDELPAEDGAETGLVYWPEDACVWWDVDPDGATSIYAGRGNQSHSVFIGKQKLPAPPDVRTAGNKIVSLPIVFEAKTETAERPVLLDIAWGWDLFLAKQGASEYDNRLAIAACALSNSAYSEEDLSALCGRLGFESPVLQNYGDFNATSAFALTHAVIEDAGQRKTVFAVVNRGSKTFTDWKGNILDETIQNARFFSECADAVAAALQKYVSQHGQPKPADNIFFVTGHSLGAIVSDLLAAQHLGEYPVRNVFTYTFAAPLADPATETGSGRFIYNILNQNDAVTSFPPRGGYKRVGEQNYTFSTRGDNSRSMARAFRFLAHMNIDELAGMSSITGVFRKPLPSILWNHSLTTYMAYLLAGGPEHVKEKKGLWSVLQTVISAVGSSDASS